MTTEDDAIDILKTCKEPRFGLAGQLVLLVARWMDRQEALLKQIKSNTEKDPQ